jgi:hypothetical protein
MITDSRGHAVPWTFDSHPDENQSGSDASTHLDGKETSGQETLSLPLSFRHSGWQRQRKQVAYALHDAGTPFSRREQFHYCGSNCFVLRSKTDPNTHRLAASCCHDRFCLPCGQGRSRTIAANIAPLLSRGQTRFITLTLRHNAARLSGEINRLYECFKKLRKTLLWKRTQVGGVAFLEVKRSRDRESWHPHFHILSQGKYIDVLHLQRTWKEITGDSWIVDVRAIKNEASVMQYVTKYASKPFDPTLYETHETLVEAIQALQGKRMIVTYGNWKGLQMTEKPTEDQWEFLDTLEGIACKAKAGDAAAMKILKAVCGDKAERMIALAADHIPERMNTGHPPIPNPQLYLLEPSTPRSTIY